MYVEETAHNAVLWARYTDAELIDIHNALVASIPPEEMMFAVRWMAPFLNPAERAAMLGDMRAQAPAPAFAAALEVVRPHLSEREWAKLEEPRPTGGAGLVVGVICPSRARPAARGAARSVRVRSSRCG